MIVVEKRLGEIFETLPPIVSNDVEFYPYYDFGTEKDLNIFLKERRQQDESYYPIIWLETPIDVFGEKRVNFDLKLILAERTSTPHPSNSERVDEFFIKTLNPLFNNVIKGLRTSGFTKITGEIKRTNYFNYLQNTDVWDAIKLESKLEMTNCNLKKIYYS